MTQLPPTQAIQTDLADRTTPETWFEYPIRVQPHHTDYAGVVWHGNYLRWLEEARVEYLRSVGVEFSELVALGCDLPVVELSLRYHRPLRLGEAAIVKARMLEMTGVRLNWDYQIQSLPDKELCLSARVSLVAVDREQGKIMRRLPDRFSAALTKLAAKSG